MDTLRRNHARALRSNGCSIKEIARIIPAAQSSVSIWVRGVELSSEQKVRLKANTHAPDVIEKRRQSRLKSELKKRNKVISNAESEVVKVTKKDLWLIATALYWAEGAKKQSMVQFSNGDPEMIRLMLVFFRQVCSVDESKLRAYIHIHEHLDAAAAEIFWQDVTKIDKSQFYKTYNKPNKSSKGARNSLLNGVCDIYVLDANLRLKIQGWTQGIYKSVNLTGQ